MTKVNPLLRQRPASGLFAIDSRIARCGRLAGSAMDALSEVLGAIRLTGAVFLDMEMRAQWSYLTAPARKIADVLMPKADHVIPYHLVTEGTCYARLLG